MKGISLSLILCLIICSLFNTPINCQTLEKESTQELSKDARKGELFTFNYNEEAGEFSLVFKREKKKKLIYEIYQFDNDLKLVKNEILDEGSAKTSYADLLNTAGTGPEPWNNPTVVRVDPGLGQIVLRQGTLTREWAKNVEEKGNYRYTTWYWKYNFEELQKVKPKFEGLIDVPEGAPKFVIKMAQSAGEKVALIAYSTDEPGVEITTGRQSFVYGSLSARTKDYASATGDILVVGRSDQMDFDTKVPKQVYLLIQFSAEDLSEIHRESFTFEYSMDLAYKQVLADGSMALIFAPNAYPGMKNKHPNPTTWEYIRVNKDATIKDRILFDNTAGWWLIKNVVLMDNDDVYIYGAGLQSKKEKHFSVAKLMSRFDNVQAMKISGGTVVYINSATLDAMGKKLQNPGNQKKAKQYQGKDMELEQISVVTGSGDLIFSGLAVDRSARYSFHFGPNGDFKGQYFVGTIKQSKEHYNDHFLFENPEGGTVTYFMGENTGEDKGRILKFPRMATIDVANATISDINTYGFGKKQEYYLDDIYPFTFIDNGQRVVFFSRNAKDSEIWLGKIKFGS